MSRLIKWWLHLLIGVQVLLSWFPSSSSDPAWLMTENNNGYYNLHIKTFYTLLNKQPDIFIYFRTL